MSSGVNGFDPEVNGGVDETSLELALTTVFGPDRVEAGLQAWREAPANTCSGSLTRTAAWVCERLDAPDRQQALYLALLRNRMTRLSSPLNQPGQATPVEAPAEAARSEPADDLQALVRGYAEALQAETGTPADDIIDAGLGQAARSRAEANQWRQWLAGGLTGPARAPDPDNGRRVLNGLWQEACELAGPVVADRILSRVVRQVEATRPAGGDSPRRYL